MELNSKEYWENRFEENWESMQGIEQTLFFANIACNLLPDFIVREIKKEKYTICDMGCALGQGTHCLSEFLGINIDGADFSKEAIQKATKMFPQNKFRLIDLMDIPDQIQYDVVYTSNVLEHFPDPWEIFDHLSKITKKYIILMVPFEETMKVSEHMYKFMANNIPIYKSGFALVYSDSIDGREIPNTYYADNQILLIYKKQSSTFPTVYISDISAKTSILNQKIKKGENLSEKLQKEILELKTEKQNLEQTNFEVKKSRNALENQNKEITQEKERILTDYRLLKDTKDREINNLQSKVADLENEVATLQQMLKEIKESNSWKCTEIIRKISSKTGFYKVSHKPQKNEIQKIQEDIQLNESAVIRKLYEFTEKICDIDDVLLVFSGVKFVENEGQRNIRLVQEAIKKNVKVIYVYWRWNIEEKIEERNNSNYFFQVPVDIFWNLKEKFFENKLVQNENKILLVEFPHKMAVDIIDIANCFGWKTIYDIIDEWEEFAKKGQAVWYNSKIEQRIINQVDMNIVTAERLRDKFEKVATHPVPFYVVSNGVNPNQMHMSERIDKYDYTSGKLQIGYFGHLTDAWFDWKLLIGMALDNKNWTFHIIGYGAPDNLNIPDNIKLYGKKEPTELPKYAAYWDVAIIPFINCELTLCVNPIKAYEYLQLGLPIVASNMPELKKFPYAQIAVGKDAFEKAIEKAANMEIDENIIEKFISENTWEKKWENIFSLTNKIRKEIC